MVKILLLAIVCGLLAIQTCAAQNLTVVASPFSPSNAGVEAGSPAAVPLMAIRFSAAGGNFNISGFTLTTGGSGNWASELSGTNGVEIWRDNGDGVFSSTSDSLLSQGSGAQPTIGASFSTAQVIADGNSMDAWVILNFLASAGGSIPTTFSASIANSTDVSATGGTVSIGSPSPTSGTVSMVIYFVTSFTPLGGGGGQDIVITGSGFTAPVSLTINGLNCLGTPVISAGNTQITGYRTGSFGGDAAMPIVLSTGLLGPRTLAFTFDQHSGGGTGPACSTTQEGAFSRPIGPVAFVAALLFAAFRQLRRQYRKPNRLRHLASV